MGKKDSKLDDLKKKLKTVDKSKLKKFRGGRKRNKGKSGCGGIIPQ